MPTIIAQLRENIAQIANSSDRPWIIRKKKFVLEENASVKRLVCFEFNDKLEELINDQSGQSTDQDLHAFQRMDTHVLAIFQFKVAVEGTELPFIGNACSASHAVFHDAGRINLRVRVKKISNGMIYLAQKVSVTPETEMRLMRIERATNKVQGMCRICNSMQTLPMFHGTPGVCYKCNGEKVNPAKVALGSHIKWLLEEGIYYEEITAKPRVFEANKCKQTDWVPGGIFTIQTETGEEVRCFQDTKTGNFRELINRDRIQVGDFRLEESKFEGGRTRYRMGDKWYFKKLQKWAEGLEKKLSELRTDQTNFEVVPFPGIFNTDETYGDKTLEHMRRMFNIARAKQVIEATPRRTFNEAVEAVNTLMEINLQPDCSRQLFSILNDALVDIRRVTKIERHLDKDWAQSANAIQTAINVGMNNTSVPHS